MKNSQNATQKIYKTIHHSISPLTAENSLSGSSRSYRKLERSKSKKSKCKSKNSDTSSVKSFYTKINYKQNDSILISPNPEENRKKKRQSTPQKAKYLINLSKDEKNVLNQQIKMLELQHRLKIAELEKKASDKDQTIQKYQRKIISNQSKIKDMTQKNSQNMKEIQILKADKSQKELKIKELEKAIIQNKSNLNEATNNLEKLRKSIKENHIQDLKNENQTLKIRIKKLEEKISFIKKQAENNLKMLQEQNTIQPKLQPQRRESFRQKYLQNELKRLRQEKQFNKSSSQKTIEQVVDKLMQQNFHLRSQNRIVSIKLKNIEKKKMQQFLAYSRAKNDELSINKEKYKKLLKSYQEKKKQILQQKEELKRFKETERVSSIFLPADRERNSSLSFQLSPE